MLAVALRGTRDSVLAAAVLHSVFNRTNIENGVAAALVDGQNPDITLLIAVVVVIVTVSVIFRRRLTRAYRRELDAVPVEHIGRRTAEPMIEAGSIRLSRRDSGEGQLAPMVAVVLGGVVVHVRHGHEVRK